MNDAVLVVTAKHIPDLGDKAATVTVPVTSTEIRVTA